MMAANQAVLRAFFFICCSGPCIFNNVGAVPGATSTVIVPIMNGLTQSNNVVRVSRTKLVGNAIDVASSLNLAYVLTDQSVLYAFNLDDPVNPLILSSLTLPGITQSLHVSGNRAYIGTRDNGVTVVDLSDPGNPVLLAENIGAGGVGAGGATDVKIDSVYGYVSNDKKQQPLSPGDFTSLVFHASLDDRVKGRTGTGVEVFGGLAELVLAEVETGVLLNPSARYTIENDFNAYLGSLQFPGGSTDGPLIIGNKADFKPLLNFADTPAIIGFWLGANTLNGTSHTLLSVGRHGPDALGNGGWSIYFAANQLWMAIGRKNHPSKAACAVKSSPGSTKKINVVDGKRHLVVAVYDPVGKTIYVYLDGVKSKVVNIWNCRADTEGDDSDALSGSGSEWLSIGEAGQASVTRSFFSGGMQNILILSPPAIPQGIDAIIREWYTLGSPGERARGVL